jgi:inward rectifier potassium channel
VSESASESKNEVSASPLRPGFLDRRGRSTVVGVGLDRVIWQDLYHQWLNASWRRVMVVVLGLYLGINTLFASAYLIVGDGIENARKGSFSDAFFFSVQTFATIGYGKMVPISLAANIVVTMEALCGLLGAAMITGLMFAKFSRPTARVLWSRIMTVAPHDGVPALMFRLANERQNQIVEATVRLLMVRVETTKEGMRVRRVIDLPLQRSQSGVFALSWLAIHRITKESPLYGATLAQLRADGVQFAAQVSGIDETFAQTVNARAAWSVDELRLNEQFEDILRTGEDGSWRMEYGRFHSTRPVTAPHERALVDGVVTP